MYEMGLFPRSLFSNDGALPTDKSSIIHHIESLSVPLTVYNENSADSVSVNNSEMYLNNRIVIIDAMAIVQQIKKRQE